MTQQDEQAELISLIGGAPLSTRVFCVGIGNEVNRPLLKQLSERAGGLAAFVSLQDDFKRQSQAFRRKLMRPVATNVSITISGVDTFDVLPGALPDLFYGAPLRMIGRYKLGGTSLVTIRAEVMGQPFEQTVEVSLPKSSDGNPEIERMWAYSRVQQLMNDIREKGSNTRVESEIVRLCEGYSIVSEYASFIVLENDSEYKRWAIERRNATRVRRDDLARQRLQGELERLREQSLASLGPKKDLQSSKPADGNSQQLAATPAVPSNPATPANEVPSAQPAMPANSQPIDLTVVPTRSNSSPTDLAFSTSSSSSNAPSNFEPSIAPSSSGAGGGGAIDPVSGLIALGLASASAWVARRRPVGNHRFCKSEAGEKSL
jgi:Ca-activated chloride channel family protein